MALRVGVAAHLIEHRTLHRQDMPIGLIWRVRTVKDLRSLIVISRFGQRAAVCVEHCLVARAFDRGLFEHGDGLRALPGAAERLGIVQGLFDICWIGAILLAVDIDIPACIGTKPTDAIGKESW